MFKDESKEENYDEEEAETVVGNSVKLEGEFESQGNIIVNGNIVGKVSTEKNIDIGEEAELKADLKGKNIVVSGMVEGNVIADRLEIKEGGEVKGNIEIKILSITEGAHFSGNCIMGEKNNEEKKDVPEREEKNIEEVEE